MTVRRFVWWKFFCLGAVPLLLIACGGGSGSSGFDAGPAAESAAIQRVLASQQCEMHDGLSICPAHEGPENIPPTPAGPGGAPTPTGAPAIDALVDQRTPIVCAPADTEGCRFTLAFTPQGFPPTTTFRVAFRSVVPNGSWRLNPEVTPSPGQGPASFVGAVDVAPAVGSAGQPTRVQLAVLVFLESPRALPATVTELVDTGAEFAFVTDALTLLPGA